MAYQAGSTLIPRLAFLDPARHYDAPEICETEIRFSGTVGAVSGGALGRDAAKLIAKVIMRDTDDFINCSGTMLRVMEQVELGGRQTDPADLTSGTTNTTYIYRLRLVHEPVKALRPRDFRIPLANMLEGGSLQIQLASTLPTGWAAAQADWQYRVYMRVVDGRTKELKSRRKIWEHVVNAQEFYYPVQGSLRAAVLGSDLTSTTGYSSWASYTTIDSQTLDFIPQLETDMLKDLYQRYSYSIGANDEISLATPGAQAVVVPAIFKKTGEMIDTKLLHLKLNAAPPASARLVTDEVIDRNSGMSALQLGYPGSDAVSAAAKTRGVTVIGDGDNPPATSFVPTLARRLPMRVSSVPTAGVNS